ncbi:hypothetical protein B0H14DRAFT_2583412 [Mycena olivaceomarginata]|nr:hypothetical protein B0H14DRAFT_2583412 [Mycena olivaceomarginata]
MASHDGDEKDEGSGKNEARTREKRNRLYPLDAQLICSEPPEMQCMLSRLVETSRGPKLTSKSEQLQHASKKQSYQQINDGNSQKGELGYRLGRLVACFGGPAKRRGVLSHLELHLARNSRVSLRRLKASRLGPICGCVNSSILDAVYHYTSPSSSSDSEKSSTSSRDHSGISSMSNSTSASSKRVRVGIRQRQSSSKSLQVLGVDYQELRAHLGRAGRFRGLSVFCSVIRILYNPKGRRSMLAGKAVGSEAARMSAPDRPETAALAQNVKLLVEFQTMAFVEPPQHIRHRLVVSIQDPSLLLYIDFVLCEARHQGVDIC